MTDKVQKKQVVEKNGVGPVVAAVAGAVVGAVAVGIAGAAVLANDSGRKQVEKAIDDAKDNVAGAKVDVEEKIAEGRGKVNKVATAVKNSTQNTVTK